MSITEQPAKTKPTAVRQIELYESAMCCETGVCGPRVDEQLIAVREDLRWAESQGASVTRHNLTSLLGGSPRASRSAGTGASVYEAGGPPAAWRLFRHRPGREIATTLLAAGNESSWGPSRTSE